MIKNIIFDMGNVLLCFDQDFFIHRLGILGPDVTLLKRKVFQTLCWARMDRGSLDEAEAAELMCRDLPERLHEAARQLVLRWDEPIVPVPGMAELVRELKGKGYAIYLLSNASRRQHEYWPRVPGSEYFDGTFISADHGLIKPQPEIYRNMLQSFGILAEESVFIDDSWGNVEGAYHCGISGIVFHMDARELREALRKLGVEV